MDRLPVYDSQTTKGEAISIITGVIPNGSVLCQRCRFLAARAILNERWRVGPILYDEADNIYFDLIDDPIKNKHAH